MTVTVTGSYLVRRGEALAFTDEPAFLFATSGGPGEVHVLNKGSVVVHTDAPSSVLTGIVTTQNYFFDSEFVNKGDFEVSSAGAGTSVIGASFWSQAPAFVNLGVFKVTSEGAATGFDSIHLVQQFYNAGTFKVVGRNPVGVHAKGGDVVNAGMIAVSAISGRAIGVGTSDGFDHVVNTGVIKVSDTTPALDSAAIEFDHWLPTGLYNSGLIQGDYALWGHTAYQPALGVWIVNTGQIVGLVQLDVVDTVTFRNAGAIVGDVHLGEGADDFNGRGGTVQGVIYGGGGGDSIVGGDSADTIDCTGDNGRDLINGGRGQDLLIGGEGGDWFAFSSLKDSTPAAPDRIADYGAEDSLELSLLDADRLTPGDQPFHLGGAGGHAGDIVVTYRASTDTTQVDLYVDNDAKVDARILISGDHSGLGASDFVL